MLKWLPKGVGKEKDFFAMSIHTSTSMADNRAIYAYLYEHGWEQSCPCIPLQAWLTTELAMHTSTSMADDRTVYPYLYEHGWL